MITVFDPSRYGRSVLSQIQSEDDVQASILKELARRKLPAWHLDAGGRQTRKVMASRGVSMGKGGQGDIPAGWPDVFAILPDGRSLFVECKRPGVWIAGKQVQKPGKATKDQIDFLTRAENNGALCLVAWSLSDLIAHLDHPINRPGLSIGERRAWRESNPRYETHEARAEKRLAMLSPAHNEKATA